MTILTVRHITTYRYKQPVSFGEHRMMLRPRESHDQRLLELRLEITPKPTNLRWIRDVFGNHVAIARFAGRAEALRFDSTIRLDHSPADIVDTDIEDFARTYPFIYGAEDKLDLVRLVERPYSDPDHQLDQWVHQFLRKGGSTNTRALLVNLNRTIKNTFIHVARHEKGIQDPLHTLEIGSGSCRDLAVLLIEAVRSLGIAARFVSGYLHVPEDSDNGCAGGNTHAWVQVYLPGPGWVDFDPASGIVGNHDLVRVAVVRDPRQAIPLQGTWTGLPSDNLGMSVEVNVTAQLPRTHSSG
jgi:transglutaminase-like putative cysteine protease